MKLNEKTILVVDDTISNLDILVELLKDYDVIDEVSAKGAMRVLEEEKIDLILLDINMPIMDGYELCKEIKQKETIKDIPIIFITAQTDELSIEKAYEIGGSDYITKPFKPKELLAKVKRELKIQELIYNLEKSQSELKRLASIDPLTNLYNRRYFSEVSKNILNLSKRDKKDLSLMIIDIDKFKNINDNYGHAFGDKVILKLVEILEKQKRKSDIICRFGGEEFVILLPQTDICGATTVAHNIREATQNIKICIDPNCTIQFTISLGISHILVEKENSIEFALNRADKALYEAKNNGRNRVCIFDIEDDNR